jgi:hypothetical protein
VAEKIQIQIDAETRSAIANLAKLQTATENVEKATKKLSASQRLIETLNTDISKLGGRVGESMRNIAMGVAGGVAAFGALAYKATEMAAAIEQQEMAINRLGPAYEAVRVATNGVVSAQDALKAQQTLVQAGIRVSAEQLGTITRAAREYARATGTETTAALEQLTDALRTSSAEGLGRFGVSLRQGQTGASAFTSALGQLQQQQQQTAVSSRTLREDLDKLPEGLMAIGSSILSVLEGPGNRMMEWLTSLGGATMNLRQFLSELAGAGDTIRQRERQAATDAANMRRLEAQEGVFRAAGAAGVTVQRGAIRGLSPERLARLQQQVATLEGVVQLGRQAAPRGTARFGVSGLAGQSLTPGFANIDLMRQLSGGTAAADAPARQQRRQAAFQQQVDVLLAEQRAEEEAARRAAQGSARPRAAGGGGGGDTGAATAMRALRDAQSEALLRRAPVVEIGRPSRGMSMQRYLELLTTEQRALTAATLTPTQLAEQTRRAEEEAAVAAATKEAETLERARVRRAERIDLQQRRFARDRETRRMARAESLGGRALSALGIETDEEGRVRAFDALQTGADLLGQSLGTLRSGFSELFNTLASGSMSAGEAFQQFAAKTLKSLGEMSINQGIALTFQGIAALFTNPVAAPLMLAGGAGLIALGTGLGAAGAAATPAAPSTGGAAPSAARSASGASPRGDMGSGGNVTIVLSSLVPPGPRELQGLVHAQRQAGRYGLGDARMVPRQVRA